MKAIIAKDNNFNTIGLEVKSKDNKNTLFAWGVCPQVEFHFVKEIEVDDFEIIRLVELNTKLAELNRFVSRFFTIATTENDVLKKGKDGHTVGVKFASVDDEISSIKATIANKIQKFI